MAYKSLENLLLMQRQKLQDLETATDLIRSKSFIHEELVNAYSEVCSITGDLDGMKEDVKALKLDNERCKKLSAIITALDQQIQHMENNIPPKIEEYVKSITSDNIENNVQENNISVNNTLNFTNFDGDTTNVYNGVTNNMKNCKKVLFNEPEIPTLRLIAEAEFSKIPKYIIGRYSLETLNSLVNNINQIIKAKYSIISLGKNGARKKGELDLFLEYKKEQLSLGPNEENTYFFTAEDYYRYTKSKIDKTKLNLLTALRNCKRIREIRSAKITNYALILSQV